MPRLKPDFGYKYHELGEEWQYGYGENRKTERGWHRHRAA
jgi:hypothetical protein